MSASSDAVTRGRWLAIGSDDTAGNDEGDDDDNDEEAKGGGACGGGRRATPCGLKLNFMPGAVAAVDEEVAAAGAAAS